TIEEHGSANFIEQPRVTELAIIDSSDPKSDAVVVVPDRILRKGGLIRHEALPVDLEVISFMRNSALPEAIPPGISNPATAGSGRSVVAIERTEVTGTDPNQKIDTPSAYVNFKNKQTGNSI